MKVGVACVGISGIYPQLVARLVNRFAEVAPAVDVLAWVNTRPQHAPPMIVNDYDYTPYCAKPFALNALAEARYDIGILLDASFVPKHPLNPLVDYICDTGYYFCDNEFMVGEWCSDAAAECIGVTRDALFRMPELSSYCVGMDLRRGECLRLLAQWMSAAYSPHLFPGHHTAGAKGRNAGFVSSDPRVKGHRHDQTILSIFANQFGMTKFVKRPRFTGYADLGWNKGKIPPTNETVLVNWGRLEDNV